MRKNHKYQNGPIIVVTIVMVLLSVAIGVIFGLFFDVCSKEILQYIGACLGGFATMVGVLSAFWIAKSDKEERMEPKFTFSWEQTNDDESYSYFLGYNIKTAKNKGKKLFAYTYRIENKGEHEFNILGIFVGKSIEKSEKIIWLEVELPSKDGAQKPCISGIESVVEAGGTIGYNLNVSPSIPFVENGSDNDQISNGVGFLINSNDGKYNNYYISFWYCDKEEKHYYKKTYSMTQLNQDKEEIEYSKWFSSIRINSITSESSCKDSFDAAKKSAKENLERIQSTKDKNKANDKAIVNEDNKKAK